MMPKKIKGPARLLDIEVDEVSLVDKAANKRKYLIVKSDEQNLQEGVEDMAEKKVTRVKKQGDNPESEASGTEGTPITDAEAGASPEAGADAAATGANAGVETDGVEKGVVTQLGDAVKSLTDKVTDLSNKIESIIPAETVKDEAGGDAEPEAGGEVETEKAGAKISKANLGKLTTAFASIKSLLKELGVDVEGGKGSSTESKVEKEAGEPASQPDTLGDITKVTESLSDVSKQLIEISKRLEAVEGLDAQSKQGGNGGATEPVEKAGSFWDGAI